MNYEHLARMWGEQRDKFQEWEFNLLRGPHLVRNRLEEILDLPQSTWTESENGSVHKYVELVDFYQKETVERRPPRGDSITEDGVLVFGVGITFDRGLNSFPKQNIYTPVAMRLVASGPEVCLFDRDSDRPSNEWTQSIDDFCNLLLTRYEESFKHDPYTDFNGQRRMGFFQEF